MTLSDVALAAGAVYLLIAIVAFRKALVVALNPYNLAAGKGLIGIAAFLAAWVLLFPLMATFCLIAGFFVGEDEPDRRRLGQHFLEPPEGPDDHR